MVCENGVINDPMARIGQSVVNSDTWPEALYTHCRLGSGANPVRSAMWVWMADPKIEHPKSKSIHSRTLVATTGPSDSLPVRAALRWWESRPPPRLKSG